MERACALLCSSTPINFTTVQLFNPNTSLHFQTSELSRPVSALSRAPCYLSLVGARGRCTFTVRSTATQEAVETNSDRKVDLVEVGFLSGVHGLQGEICIKPNTDFPDLRFSKPGRRWLKQQLMGQDKIHEVELVEGRPHPAQKSWILKFRGLDDVDQVRQLVGATLLAEEDDRPELDDGEFYSRDLLGMKVLLKETGQLVGTVANVFDNGGNDLLHVLLDSSMEACNGTAKTNQLVWIPFVDAIVPDVDLERREMYITPPKGLLEVNMRIDERSKKERRQLEWKERKKQQKKLISAKKKLCELEQKHVFDGLRFGEKSQRSLLADHILDVNSTLLQKALQSIENSSKKRWNLSEEINALRVRELVCTLNVSREGLGFDASKEKVGDNFSFLQQGKSLFSEGKVSICLVLNDHENEQLEGGNGAVSYLQTLLDDEHRFLKEEGRACVPLVIVSPEHAIEDVRNLFEENDYFGFESEKVWFLKEETLPVVCCSSPEEPKKHKILMKSPWEILKSPVGSGGVLSVLASHGITDSLSSLGIDYLQVHSIETRSQTPQHHINPMLVGFVSAKGGEIGVQVTEESEVKNSEMILTLKFLKRLKGKIEFEAVMKMNSHVQMVEKEWVESVPTEPNSFEFRSDIYRVLGECSSSAKICLMNVTV